MRSTGAKTPEGKKRSSQNAYKTGRSLEIRELFKYLNRVLRSQKDLLR
jgi:phage tail tape-measure protein